MTTLKQHIEAIQSRHGRDSHADDRYCGGCNRRWPCSDYKATEAALAILNFKPLPKDEEARDA